ncbi:hypothetical protein [Halorussus aquaticus]|uniref:Uncharacterized protein n=1 Tax=Halorussus aquaticus TaxID=2953748 RepID=A0ABD5Q255_9EURY|nr:hypothetical protein [Halorussus aquaticus]
MNRRLLAAAVVLLGTVGGGVLFADGAIPGASPSDGTTPSAETTDTEAGASPTGTDSSDSDAGGTTTGTTDDREYAFTILTVEKCGSTCRDVTARLDNTGGTPRENVRVTTKMYADDELLWSGTQTVGTLGPGESHTSTKRVDVGFSGGMAISANDGYVTIVTVVRSDSGTTRFSERRKVA